METPSLGALEAYRDIIAQRLSKFKDAGQECLLVIDGADETQLGGWDLGDTLFPVNPPPGLRILVTARRLVGDRGAEGWRRRLGWAVALASVVEMDLEKLSVHEVSGLVEQLLEAPLQRTSRLTEEIFRLSEKGDPLLVELYAGDVRKALCSGGETPDAIADQLSKRESGLGPYFEDWMKEQKKSFAEFTLQGTLNFTLIEATLLLLATALGPLRYSDLGELLHRVLPDQHIPGKSVLLESLSRFVIGDDSSQGRGYTLGHPLFGSFLEENQYNGNPLLERCRQAFVRWGGDVLSELRAGACTPEAVPAYLLDLYPQHLVRQQGSSIAMLRAVLSNEWVEACRRASKDTAFAVAAESVLEVVARRLDRQGAPEPETLGTGVRAALFLASLREAASFTDPGLLALAIKHGVLDLQSVLARKAFVSASARVEMLVSLAHSDLFGLDKIALWREARSIAANDQSPEQARLLDTVLSSADLVIRESQSQIAETDDIWRDLLGMIRALLAAPTLWPYRTDLRLPFRIFVRVASREWLIDLTRVLLDSPLDQALLPEVLAEFSEELIGNTRRQPDGQEVATMRPVDRLVEIFVALVDKSSRGRMAYAIIEVLNSCTDQTPAIVTSYLAESTEHEVRVRGSATILGVLIGTGGPPSAQQAAFDVIVNDTDSDFMLRLISTHVLSNATLQVPQLVCERLWRASSAISADHPRLRTRAEILRLMPDKSPGIIFPLMKEEAYAQPTALTDLIRVGAHHLSPEKCREFLALYPTDQECDGPAFEPLKRRAGKERRSRPGQRVQIVRNPITTKVSEPDEFDRLTSSSDEVLSDTEFARALDIARQTEHRWRRSRRMMTLARRAPASQKRAVILEALGEGGALEDQAQALQAIVQLARIVGFDELKTALAEVFAGVSRLEPGQALEVATNIRYLVPQADRREWAICAISAARRNPPGTAERTRAMARVANTFQKQAPFRFGIESLRGARALSDEMAGWVYRNLINARRSIATAALVIMLTRYKSMSSELRVKVSAFLRLRHRRLLFWFPLKLRAELDAMDQRPEKISAILELARTFGGSRRERLIARFSALLKRPQPDAGLLWTSQFHPIRYLYEGSDRPMRDRIRHAIAECSDKEQRLHYELCLFPALSESERIARAPTLLREIRPPMQSAFSAGSPAERHFERLLVLLLYSPQDTRIKALLELLRVGAHMSRRRWFYDLQYLPSILPTEVQAKLSAVLFEAVNDAVRLWP
jgi:hypothetical protein